MVKQHRAVVLVAVAGLLGLAAVGLLRRTGAEPIEIATAEVTSGPIVRRIMVTGTLEPMRAVAIGSQVSGTIQSVEVDFNDTVKAGQIVARLDPSLYEARLIEAAPGSPSRAPSLSGCGL
jgi:HlyD family secretion protein